MFFPTSSPARVFDMAETETRSVFDSARLSIGRHAAISAEQLPPGGPLLFPRGGGDRRAGFPRLCRGAARLPPAERLAAVAGDPSPRGCALCRRCRLPVLRTAHGAVRQFLEADVRLRCALRHLLPVEPVVLRERALGAELRGFLAGLQIEGTGGHAADGTRAGERRGEA